MKKIIKKLSLDRETLIPLQRDELGNIVGGDAGTAPGCHSRGCPDLTITRGTLGTINTIRTTGGVSKPISLPPPRTTIFGR
jgi:hypothetical protein